jgi:hypothetical protein
MKPTKLNMADRYADAYKKAYDKLPEWKRKAMTADKHGSIGSQFVKTVVSMAETETDDISLTE